MVVLILELFSDYLLIEVTIQDIFETEIDFSLLHTDLTLMMQLTPGS